MKSLTKNFLSNIFPKSAPTKAAAKPRTVRNDAPQWKELGKLTSRNVRGLSIASKTACTSIPVKLFSLEAALTSELLTELRLKLNSRNGLSTKA